MNWMRTLRTRIRALFAKRTLDAEMDEEMRSHIELQTQENIANGMSPREARFAALRQFGHVDGIKESAREQREGFVVRQLSLVTQDVRFAIRQLLKNRGFTAVAVLSLALAIGANTAIFSLINTVMLRSLPVPNPHELRVINWTARNASLSHYSGDGTARTVTGLSYGGSFPYPTYCEFRDRGVGLAEVFAFNRLPDVTTLARGHASVSDGLMISGNFFQGYGATTLIGRTITPEDDQPGAPPVAVITHQWWERYFDLAPDVLGETVTVNKHAFTVIGVLLEDYVGPVAGDPTDIYLPFSAQPQMKPAFPLESSRHWWVQIMARLAPGANDAQAQASLAVLFPQALEMSDTRMDQANIWLQDGSRGPLMLRQRAARPMWALLIVVGVVLLIACANLASLLLARGATRQHEMAVRAAIGAGRWRLMRQPLVESLLLALAGGVLGLVFASWGKAALLAALSNVIGELSFDTRMDFKVLTFTLVVSVMTALFFGLLPALRTARADAASCLKDRSALGAPRLRMGRALVSLQIALSMVLLVGASLMIQTFSNLNSAHPGFDVENLLLFRLNPEQAGYGGQQRVDYFDEVTRSLGAIPGVRAVSCSSLALAGGYNRMGRVRIPGGVGEENYVQASKMAVNDSFFSTVGLPLVLGREFNTGDTHLNYRVIIINETFARMAFADAHPVGRVVSMGDQDYRIVGVCHDATYSDIRKASPPTMYLSHRQSSPGAMYMEVRSALSPMSLVPAVHKAMAALDPQIPVTDLKTQRQQIERSITPERIIALLCGFLALLAVLLSCIGIYGIMAYSVARRVGEFGIRMALGARPVDVAKPVLRGALMLAMAGLAVGLPLAFGFAQVIRHFLFGIQPHDPVTLIGGIILMTFVAVLAAWIPARRAMKVDPMVALRAE